MLQPLSQWICDVCGNTIVTPADGYVVWQTDNNFRPHSFRIIHQVRCDKDRSFHASLALDTFLGEKGRQRLLSFLSMGIIKKNQGQSGSKLPLDMDEFVDFFRRVQTPYYEEARMRFGDSNVLDWFNDENGFTPYMENELISIIKKQF